MTIAAIILTRDEARHLERCVASARQVADTILVVDSCSTDETPALARTLGAEVVQRPFVNYAAQFNWALTQCPPDTEWVLRIDADEYLTPELVAEIRARLPLLGTDIDGVHLGRRITFQGKAIRYGGLFPARILRLFRAGRGRCEARWMDEHIKVAGRTVDFAGEIIDDNLASLTWWTAKHNSYASREAIDLLNLEFGFMPHDTVASLGSGSQPGIKRWIKERVYAQLPGGLRALVYFLYRYVVRLGFLDGAAGRRFHVLQGFWYRYLVDAKIAEVKRHMSETGCDPVTAIREKLGIEVGCRAG